MSTSSCMLCRCFKLRSFVAYIKSKFRHILCCSCSCNSTNGEHDPEPNYLKMILVFIMAVMATMTANLSQASASTPYELEVLAETNKMRKAHGLKDLAIQDKLRNAARNQSNEMCKQAKLSHDVKYSLDNRMKHSGYQYQSYAENIATAPSGIAAVQQWMNSEGHKKNILNPHFKHIGIGISLQKDGKGNYFYTQIFGQPKHNNNNNNNVKNKTMSKGKSKK